METILVPLDGSALAEQAMPYARLLATLLVVPVRLLRVVGHAEVDGLVAGGAALQAELGGDEAQGFERATLARKVLARHAEEALGHYVEELAAAGVAASAEVRFGRPASEIRTSAREHHDALLILTPHDYDGTLGPPSSAVLDAVIKAARAPVLVVRSATVTLGDERALELRRLLVPIDEPARAQPAFDWALRLASAADAEVLLLHADLTADHDSGVGGEGREELSGELRALAAEASARHGVTVQAVVVAGITQDAILETAAERAADLIVMGAEPRGWLERRLLGSVADDVRRATLVPLLIIPERT